MDIARFRSSLPEFADIVRYPDSQLEFWATFAEHQVDCRRWKHQTYMGVFLYVAHEITIAASNQRSANIGGPPGGLSGPANSKTVGSVTVAYDTQQTAEKDAGYWNLTTYGKKFIHLARIFGVGTVQV